MNENVRPATPIARVVLASFIGTSIEWYDFFLYGTAAALVFNKLYSARGDLTRSPESRIVLLSRRKQGGVIRIVTSRRE
jgi:hypothetical protein